jgi:hypothetical protein
VETLTERVSAGRLNKRLQNFADVEPCGWPATPPTHRRDAAQEQTLAACELLSDCAVTFLFAGTFQRSTDFTENSIHGI